MHSLPDLPPQARALGLAILDQRGPAESACPHCGYIHPGTGTPIVDPITGAAIVVAHDVDGTLVQVVATVRWPVIR